MHTQTHKHITMIKERGHEFQREVGEKCMGGDGGRKEKGENKVILL